MQKLFPCRKTVLGDASQSVNPYGSSTADMIQKALVTGEVMKLFKSYRSTYEITDFAQKIRTNTDLEPVARHGEKPKVLQFNNEKYSFPIEPKFGFCAGYCYHLCPHGKGFGIR